MTRRVANRGAWGREASRDRTPYGEPRERDEGRSEGPFGHGEEGRRQTKSGGAQTKRDGRGYTTP